MFLKGKDGVIKYEFLSLVNHLRFYVEELNKVNKEVSEFINGGKIKTSVLLEMNLLIQRNTSRENLEKFCLKSNADLNMVTRYLKLLKKRNLAWEFINSLLALHKNSNENLEKKIDAPIRIEMPNINTILEVRTPKPLPPPSNDITIKTHVKLSRSIQIVPSKTPSNFIFPADYTSRTRRGTPIRERVIFMGPKKEVKVDNSKFIINGSEINEIKPIGKIPKKLRGNFNVMSIEGMKRKKEMEKYLIFERKIRKLLNKMGYIKSIEKVPLFIKQMYEVKSDREKQYILDVLIKTESRMTFQKLVDEKGIVILHDWLKTSVIDSIIKKILKVFNLLQVNKKMLKETGIGKSLNKLIRKTKNINIKNTCENIIKRWKKIIKDQSKKKVKSPTHDVNRSFEKVQKVPKFKPMARKKRDKKVMKKEYDEIIIKEDVKLNKKRSRQEFEKEVPFSQPPLKKKKNKKKKKKRVSWAKDLFEIREYEIDDSDGIVRRFKPLGEVRSKERLLLEAARKEKQRILLKEPEMEWMVPVLLEDTSFKVVDTPGKIEMNQKKVSIEFPSDSRISPMSPVGKNRFFEGDVNVYPFIPGEKVQINQREEKVEEKNEDDEKTMLTTEELEQIQSLLTKGENENKVQTISPRSYQSPMNISNVPQILPVQHPQIIPQVVPQRLPQVQMGYGTGMYGMIPNVNGIGIQNVQTTPIRNVTVGMNPYFIPYNQTSTNMNNIQRIMPNQMTQMGINNIRTFLPQQSPNNSQQQRNQNQNKNNFSNDPYNDI